MKSVTLIDNVDDSTMKIALENALKDSDKAYWAVSWIISALVH